MTSDTAVGFPSTFLYFQIEHGNCTDSDLQRPVNLSRVSLSFRCCHFLGVS